MKGRSGTMGPENATPGVISIMYNGEPLAIPPGFTRNQAAEIAEAVTWPHRYNLPRKYRPTYQGYLLNFMLDSALFAAVTIRKG